MPRLLIVDDEETIRLGLESMVQRLLPHWEIAGSCEDAEHAWEMIGTCHPDLAIIDIGMPGTSGLELALRLQEHRPDVNKIILTGYDKFAYIQSAMRADVTDYLLKPVQRDELVTAFRKVEGILNERADKARLRLEKTIINSIVAGKTDSLAELEKWLSYEGMQGESVRYGIAIRYTDQWSDGQRPVEEEEERRHYPAEWREGLASGGFLTVNATLSDRFEMTLIAGHGLPSPDKERSKNKRNGIAAGPTGFGGSVDKLQLLPDVFRQAQDMLYQCIPQSAEAGSAEEAERTGKMSVALELNDLKAVLQLLEEWRAELGNTGNAHPLIVFTRIFRFVAYFASMQSSRLQSSLMIDMHAEITRLSSRLLMTGDPNVLLRAIDQFIERISMLKSEQSDDRRIIGKVKETIRREFGNPDFSLEQAAHSVHLNPTYLSELFKETTGSRFIDYLTDIRLEEARRLLTETDMKMYEVCLSVGYTSSKYFSTLFRKKFEVTPTMYREGYTF